MLSPNQVEASAADIQQPDFAKTAKTNASESLKPLDCNVHPAKNIFLNFSAAKIQSYVNFWHFSNVSALIRRVRSVDPKRQYYICPVYSVVVQTSVGLAAKLQS